ncbi:MAG: J domain-containing protein [Aquihabitans sp.]
MLLAELEILHSRPVAPTRRVAIGSTTLPTDPAPGYGGILLAGIAAAFVSAIDPDLLGDLHRLTHQLQDGQRIPQPRLRHRFQDDQVGLNAHRHRLIGDGERLHFEFDEKGNAAPYVLGAVYAAGRLPADERPPVFELIRQGLLWRGDIGPELVAYLTGTGSSRRWALVGGLESVAWALDVFGLENAGVDTGDVQRRFRELLRQAHPDHGGASDGAADRINDLTTARQILLGAR